MAAALFLLLDLAVPGLNFYIATRFSESASAINLAGRQRMTKALLSAELNRQQGNDISPALATAAGSARVFDATLDGFREGGMVVDGREALGMLRCHDIGLLLTDCQMAEMDGFTLCRRLRESEGGLRHLPVPALTASPMAEERERCLEAGMDDVLVKPSLLPPLRQALQTWLPASAPGQSANRR